MSLREVISSFYLVIFPIGYNYFSIGVEDVVVLFLFSKRDTFLKDVISLLLRQLRYVSKSYKFLSSLAIRESNTGRNRLIVYWSVSSYWLSFWILQYRTLENQWMCIKCDYKELQKPPRNYF